MTDHELARLATQTHAIDCLEDHGLHADAETLRAAPGRAALLERAVGLLEDRVRIGARPRVNSPWVLVIAEHRGEAPQETLDRLTRRDRDGSTQLESGMSALDLAQLTEIDSGIAEANRDSFSPGVPRNQPSAARVPSADMHSLRDAARGMSWASPFSDEIMEAAHQVNRREREDIEAFIRDVGATPETHHHVVYPAPEEHPVYDPAADFRDPPGRLRTHNPGKVHVLIPVGEVPEGNLWPTREEACRRYPNRWIGRRPTSR